MAHDAVYGTFKAAYYQDGIKELKEASKERGGFDPRYHLEYTVTFNLGDSWAKLTKKQREAECKKELATISEGYGLVHCLGIDHYEIVCVKYIKVNDTPNREMLSAANLDYKYTVVYWDWYNNFKLYMYRRGFDDLDEAKEYTRIELSNHDYKRQYVL